MKLRSLLVALSLGAMALPQAAAAKGIPIVRGETQHLAYVAETTIPAPTGGTFALCHHYTSHSLYWVNAWSTSTGYVLSDVGCEETGYFDMPDVIAAGFADGQITGVPQSPSFTALQIANGFTWPLIAGVVLIGIGLMRLRSQKRYKSQSAERMEVLGLEEGPMFRFIDAMLHAANADGQAQQEEIAYIRAKATEVTGLAYTDEHIEWAITHTDKFKRKHEFKQFGLGLNVEQRRVVLRAALAVVASDSHMSQPEKDFISGLTSGLGLGQGDLQAILQEGQHAPAAA